MDIVIFILVIFLIIILVIYNSLIKKRNAVKQSRSSIDVYLTQRFDLIPNLVECVKGYSRYEKETLESMTKLRTEYNQTKDLKKASELNNQIDKVLLTAENYPDLKASQNFLNLQKNLSKMEDQLQAARRLYNMEVTRYNNSIQTFPTNILASVFSFKSENLFEIETGKDVNIKIDL